LLEQVRAHFAGVVLKPVQGLCLEQPMFALRVLRRVVFLVVAGATLLAPDLAMEPLVPLDFQTVNHTQVWLRVPAPIRMARLSALAVAQFAPVFSIHAPIVWDFQSVPLADVWRQICGALWMRLCLSSFCVSHCSRSMPLNFRPGALVICPGRGTR
jgi:hypothetical protein